MENPGATPRSAEPVVVRDRDYGRPRVWVAKLRTLGQTMTVLALSQDRKIAPFGQ
jgi:hypothetical protein